MILSGIDKIRIQAALDRARETGVAQRVYVECDGWPMRVLVSKKLNHAEVLAARAPSA